MPQKNHLLHGYMGLSGRKVLMKNKICEIESIIKRYGQIHRYMDINGIIWSIDTRPDNKRKYKETNTKKLKRFFKIIRIMSKKTLYFCTYYPHSKYK